MPLDYAIPRKRAVTVTGVGAGWSDPVRFSQIGRAGVITLVHFRGDVTDATTGTAEMLVFRAPAPSAPADFSSFPTVALATSLDPTAITRVDKALQMSGITIAPHATDPSDEDNIRLATGGGATFDRRPGFEIWVAIKGVTGAVHIGIESEGH